MVGIEENRYVDGGEERGNSKGRREGSRYLKGEHSAATRSDTTGPKHDFDS